MATHETPDTAQAEVIAFLSRPESHGTSGAQVDVIETHGALVFLAGDTALKIKRAVHLAYLDFSTLAKREAVCRKEIEINRPNAPDIYRDVVAITREADGRLAIGGKGEPVEWAVRMARFDQDALLSRIAERSGIDDRLASELALTMLAAHEGAEPRPLDDAAQHVRRIIEGIDRSFGAASTRVAGLAGLHVRFMALAIAQLERVGGLLRRRADARLVRRCHGDAHLGNIVLWKGHPQLFDAIEFDEKLATIDLLYDLAFLLMDLDRRGQRRAARIVLDHYLSRTERTLDLEGLAALPAVCLAEIRTGIAALARQGTGPYVCPLLDQASGACPVYAQRPVACRSYGFYVQRDKGLYCGDIEQQVTAGALAEVVWGNHDGVDRQLAGLGESRTLVEWFDNWRVR
jgi:aminoglycoside phosphotransferase family enzyme